VPLSKVVGTGEHDLFGDKPVAKCCRLKGVS